MFFFSISNEDVIVDEQLSTSCSEEEEKDKEDNAALILDPCEAFFLSFSLGCLLIKDSKFPIELPIATLWEKFNIDQRGFDVKYAVYHHFRRKNFVVKDGTKFGADFLLYKEGPPFYHASYSVRIVQQVTMA